MFTLLPPGGKIGKHRDPFAGSVRYHLGLSTPNDDKCWIEVDGNRASWRDGQGFMFDETYVHEALNGADSRRLILFCDVERPVRWPFRGINRWMIAHVMGATGAPNEEGEKVGALNRFFERIHGVLESGKKLKAKNRRLYYAIKYSLIVAILALIII
jgi:beta-hydroxylase